MILHAAWIYSIFRRSTAVLNNRAGALVKRVRHVPVYDVGKREAKKGANTSEDANKNLPCPGELAVRPCYFILSECRANVATEKQVLPPGLIMPVDSSATYSR